MDVTDFKNGFRYQSFKYHPRACVVCGEDRVVDVHHINEKELDHDEKNIVPLCPTHHRYLHSHWPEEVMPHVERYLAQWALGSRSTGQAQPDMQYLERRCCHCGEDRIVNIVPVDGDEMNVSPLNLVPLCPTHHALYAGTQHQFSFQYGDQVAAPEVKASVQTYVAKIQQRIQQK